MLRSVLFNGIPHVWSWWTGEKVRGTIDTPCSWDTETRLLKLIREAKEGESNSDIATDPRDIPSLAIGVVFDGEKLFAIHPTRFQSFFSVNQSQVFVAHNTAFDWWVAYQAMGPAGKQILWTMAERGLFKDSMILDMLLQLSTGKYRNGSGSKGGDDEKLTATNLGVLAKEWGAGEVDKKSEYRLRFGEWVGLSKEQIENYPNSQDFFNYCMPDVLSLHSIYPQQRVVALELMQKAGWSNKPGQKTYEILPDAVRKWDVLSLDIQVRASITLAHLSRTPLRIDQVKRQELEEGARSRYTTCIKTMMELEPEVVHRFKPKKYVYVDGVKVRNENKIGELKLNSSTGFPKLNDKVLKLRLVKEAKELGVEAPISKGKTKAISKSAKDWEPFAKNSPFLTAFCGQNAEQKLMSFFLGLESEAGEVYTRYDLLKRSGRTSANQWKSRKERILPSVNVQQIPKENDEHPERDVRQLFCPSPGHKWLAVDYKAIEMSTLAASCVARFGFSKLREGIVNNTKGGPDLHQITGAAIKKMPVEEFLQLPVAIQSKVRKNAKEINFGMGGGMGAPRFVLTVARKGVHFTIKEAREAKKAWLKAYPEMELHLADSTQLALAWQSGLSLRQVPPFSFLQKKRFGEYLMGKEELTPAEMDYFWELIEGIGEWKEDQELLKDVSSRRVTSRVKRLFEYRASTLTGRVRNNVTYSSGKNAVFQGLAADGAKEGIFKLMSRGYKLLMFVHDEICFDVPEKQLERDRVQIEKIMVDEMAKVVGHSVPIQVESGSGSHWTKG